MSDERRPRSRFDSDDAAEPPARSRFDTERRSRSPRRREPEAQRARSPVAREAPDSPAADKIEKAKSKAAAAAAAAARINAQIQAKKGIQHVDVPPIRAVSPPDCLTARLSCTTINTSPQVAAPPVVKSPSAGPGQAVSSEIYQQDGDFIKDVEINDLRNRYTLTKGAVQKRVNNFCRLPLIYQHHAISSLSRCCCIGAASQGWRLARCLHISFWE
jgi:hypothetical protein